MNRVLSLRSFITMQEALDKVDELYEAFASAHGGRKERVELTVANLSAPERKVLAGTTRAAHEYEIRCHYSKDQENEAEWFRGAV